MQLFFLLWIGSHNQTFFVNLANQIHQIAERILQAGLFQIANHVFTVTIAVSVIR